MDINKLEMLPQAVLEAFAGGLMVQVVYVTLTDGQKLVFLGPPMDQNDVENVQEVVFGEHVHAALLHHVSQKHQRLTVQ
jgi:hypothetical protein